MDIYKSIKEEQNLRKVSLLLYNFLITRGEGQSSSFDNCIPHCNADSLNLVDLELPLINTKPMNKNKLKEWLSEL